MTDTDIPVFAAPVNPSHLAGARAMYEAFPDYPNGAQSIEHADGRIERVTPPIAWDELREDQRKYYLSAFWAGLAAMWRPMIPTADICVAPHDAKRALLYIPAEPFGPSQFVGIFAWKERECARGDDHGRAWFDNENRELKRRATHWQPLPPAPQPPAEGGV